MSIALAAIGWSALILLPKSELTQRLVQTKLLHCLICIVYVIAIFSAKGVPPEAGFFTIPGVLALFTSSDAVVGAWIHIIVFDLFIGTWIFEDAQLLKFKHVLVVPILILTLMFGPLGFLLYVSIRSLREESFY